MSNRNRRQPVPARAEPTPAAIDAVAQTPPEAERSATGEPTTPASDAAPAEPAPAAPQEASTSDETSAIDDATEARVLVAFGDNEVNDVVEGTPGEIEALMLSGYVDPHPDAVAYARSLTA